MHPQLRRRFVLIRRQVEEEHAVRARGLGVGEEGIEPVAIDRVHVSVEYDGNLALAADGAHAFEDALERRAAGECACAGELVHDSIGERIAERDSDFHDVHSRAIEGGDEFARGGEIRIARAQVRDESRAALCA